MQPYTHLLIGEMWGVGLYADNPLAHIVCIGASVGPDLVMIPNYAIAWLTGKKPLEEQSALLMACKQITHSFPLCLTITATISALLPYSWQEVNDALAIGWLLHIFIDVLTHGTGRKENRPYWDTDVTFMYPLNLQWPILDLRPLGVYEYRSGIGIRWPKPFEGIVDVVVSTIIVILW